MKKMPCSIFNDVLGPVMRGPSSSHVAGAARIASLFRQSFDNRIKEAAVDFDVNGSLAASHEGHGSDMGFACGLMGLDLSDPAVDQYEQLLAEKNIQIQYRILDYGAIHPGNYRISAEDTDGIVHRWEAISVGGGMIKVWKVEDFQADICGDFYELLAVCDTSFKSIEEFEEIIKETVPESDFTQADEKNGKGLLNLKFSQPVSRSLLDDLRKQKGILEIMYLEPVLFTHSSADCHVPYSNAAELMEYAEKHTMEPWEYGAYYESCRSGLNMETVYQQMKKILLIMENAVDLGLKGTTYHDRILGAQSFRIEQAKAEGKLIPCDLMNEIIKSISAVMEVKSSMGVIVAAPTCGSCGCLAGTVTGLGRTLKMSEDDMVKGLFMAGLIGVFFAEAATFSAEVGGCQVECGAGSGMAAGAVTQMMGGSIAQCLDSASMALQNITGLACDPVGNRVEVPCLGKNIMAGSNAVASADMVLAGYDKVIPLDETIQAIYDIGKMLPLELRCTFGGLGKTKTALEILEKTKRHFQ